MSTLTKKNALGFFEIRLESIGGLGANLAGKMLAETGALELGFNAANFSSYGSEKKGSPVKTFVRFCDPEIEIRDHSPIEQPHLIAVFHEALYKIVNVASGLQPDGVILVNTTRGFDEVRSSLNVESGTVALIDAMGIAVEEKTKINTAMLGAMFRICDFLDPEAMRTVIRRTFEKKYPQLVEPNLRTFDRGFNEVRFMTYDVPEGSQIKPFKRVQSLLGYQTQLPGGVIMAQGNSILKDLGGSRAGLLPEFHAEKCISCAACDNVCPDYCFVWEAEADKRGRMQQVLRGIDYQYCKGCLKCIEACPTDALSSLREEPGYAEQHRVAQVFS
ncbi:2-oxoacid:acceptor oxidoreductase family protein [Paenibacillus typhae]|uniref:Pyruvate ferredoxin oxidoreductase gamma subunit n=1 Tax=Paenibacillus typhae TaxID=1174501 RepID=A0A1G8P6I7_9BACL|nr:2-oxoacid:acceptor oxidoreductase family protein [Paenibacillus typhae]SDI87908.1 pyruvate ferredoxin oxidoreductase gamma subunit [Paenibacillus typhae]